MQQYQEGQTATLPNGERAIHRGGQWVKLPANHPLARPQPGLHQIVAPHPSLGTEKTPLENEHLRLENAHLRGQVEKADKEANKPEILSSDDIDLQASLYLSDPKTIAALGYRNVAREKIIHRATELAHQWGMSAADIIAGRAKVKAGEFAYRHLLDRSQAILAFERTAEKNGQMAVDLARQLQARGGTSQFPSFNKWLHGGMHGTGDVLVDQLYAATKVAADEFTKVSSSVSGAGVNSDAASQKSYELFNGAKTFEQLAGVYDILKKDMHNRVAGNDEQLSSVLDGIKSADPATAARLATEAKKAEAVKAPGDIGFSGNTDPNLKRFTPTQLQAFHSVLDEAKKSNNPSLIDAFMKGIGHTGASNARQILDHYKKTGQFSDAIDDSAAARQRAEELKASLDSTGRGAGGTKDVVTHSAAFGLDRPAAGAVNAVSKALQGDFNVSDNYAAGRDAQGMRLEEARKNVGSAAIPLELAGGLVGVNPSGAVRTAMSEAPTTGQLMKQGAKFGAGAGGLTGFNDGTGFVDSVKKGAVGGVVGGVLGGAIPGVIHGSAQQIRDFTEIVRRIRQGDPNLAVKMVGSALKNEKITPQDAAKLLSEAHADGQPMTLADIGDNPRALGASMSRYPEGRTLATKMTQERQEGQGDRIRGAIEKHLGPIADVPTESDRLTKTALENAKPLYAKAYWADGAANFANRKDIQTLLQRPSMQRALKGALTLAKEEGRSPTTLGMIERPDGTVDLGKGLSWRSMDYIKRGLDGVVESSVNQRGKLTGDGRAFQGTLREFREKMKVANPAYREALKAYSDPAQLRDALETGEKGLKLTRSQLAQVMKEYTPAQREQFKLGYRSALSEAMDAKGDGANKVLAVLGDPKKRKALGHLFGDQEGFDHFTKFLLNEQAMHKTYYKVHGSALTAERTLEDASHSNEALTEKARAGLGVAKDGLSGVRRHLIGRIDDTINFGNATSAQSAREGAASILFNPDISQFKNVLGDVVRRNGEAANRAGAFGKLVSKATPPVAINTGNALGQYLGDGR